LFRFLAIPLEAKSALVLTVVVIFFHILDRQIEFTSRTDFLWKAKLKVEQEEVETMRGINKASKQANSSARNVISIFADPVGEHPSGTRGRALFGLQGHAGTLSREVLVYSGDVRIDTQLQRVLRRERRQ
jgi:hypothetical protein